MSTQITSSRGKSPTKYYCYTSWAMKHPYPYPPSPEFLFIKVGLLQEDVCFNCATAFYWKSSSFLMLQVQFEVQSIKIKNVLQSGTWAMPINRLSSIPLTWKGIRGRSDKESSKRKIELFCLPQDGILWETARKQELKFSGIARK